MSNVVAAFPPTHEVTNQPPNFEPCNLYRGDLALARYVAAFGGAWGTERLDRYGALAGGELMELGFLANENPPYLRSHDRYGHRIDEVDFHPAYHRLLETGIENGMIHLPWTADCDGAHVVRAALAYLHSQAEAGTACPLGMSYAAMSVLRADPEIGANWEALTLSGKYDPRFGPVADKQGATLGMGMTEKQGGSDVRANTTRAEPAGSAWRLTGHKWFLSAPMSDAFIILAQAPEGPTCFLLPRWTPDGKRNSIAIQRLKDKLGNRANASAEVEFGGAWAQSIGLPGRGIATIMAMVRYARLECLTSSAALMRQALAQAIHHTRHRQAFGKPLVDQPLMTQVLADLALESEAALVLALFAAWALDRAPADESAAQLARIVTAIGKYWVCKRAPAHINECQECLGGAGYVEESILPRLYREAPVNSIWEGAGNIQCLDVLRTMQREPAALGALLAELESVRGQDERYDRALDRLGGQLTDQRIDEARARRLTGGLAQCLQAALLLKYAQPQVAEAFCATRLSDLPGRAYGDFIADIPSRELVEAALN